MAETRRSIVVGVSGASFRPRPFGHFRVVRSVMNARRSSLLAGKDDRPETSHHSLNIFQSAWYPRLVFGGIEAASSSLSFSRNSASGVATNTVTSLPRLAREVSPWPSVRRGGSRVGTICDITVPNVSGQPQTPLLALQDGSGWVQGNGWGKPIRNDLPLGRNASTVSPCSDLPHPRTAKQPYVRRNP